MSQIVNPPLLLTPNKSKVTDKDSIDIKKIIAVIAQNWWWFILSVIVCVGLTYVYLKYVSPSWHIASKILVVDEKNSSKNGIGGALSGDVGSLFNSNSNSDNEIQILKSRTLMKKTVDDMQLNVRTYLKEGFKTKEIYQESPFTVNVSYKVDTLTEREYNIEVIDNKKFIISNEDENLKQTAMFGEVVRLNQINLLLRYKKGFNHAANYQLHIKSPDAAISEFSENFTVALSDKQATTIDLLLTYPNSAKGEAILNKIVQIYLLSNLQNEKQIADSTMAFIDSRILLVSSELNNIEKQFEQYKTKNNLANITEQSKTLIGSASDYFDKLAQQETQLTIIKDIERTLKSEKNNFIPSSLINSTDQSFGQAIISYNELLQSRDKALLSYTEDNPVLLNIDKQIDNIRSNLLKNIDTYKKSLQVGKSELQKQNSGFTGKLKELPGKERNYLDFARQQNLKQELYLFLLQKREETAITKNSTFSSSRVIDTAKSDFYPFKPRKSIIYAIGFILGLIIPTICLFIKELFNTRINSKSDIENITGIPILGEIGHNSDKQSLVTGANSRSVISEQFRSLRTNLQFILDSSKSNVIMFTSSMSGEGKSFLSLNLGSALALTGKRIVFMEMDLRKPKLSESLGLSIDNGFTNYAISEDNDFDIQKIIKPLSFSNNCYLVSSGPIPPNPAELLVSNKFSHLINYLKDEFDYIIIDTAPVGLVTDALIIQKFADLLFYVTRQGYTYKSQLNIANELVDTNNVNNIYLVVNDIKAESAGNSGYRQSYGYGLEQTDKPWLSKIKFWKN